MKEYHLVKTSVLKVLQVNYVCYWFCDIQFSNSYSTMNVKILVLKLTQRD